MVRRTKKQMGQGILLGLTSSSRQQNLTIKLNTLAENLWPRTKMKKIPSINNSSKTYRSPTNKKNKLKQNNSRMKKTSTKSMITFSAKTCQFTQRSFRRIIRRLNRMTSESRPILTREETDNVDRIRTKLTTVLLTGFAEIIKDLTISNYLIRIGN